ncbi:MAG: hypothetical protein V1792_11960 [Pseudomonadota bacterium]
MIWDVLAAWTGVGLIYAFVAHTCAGRPFRAIDFILFTALGPVLWGCLFLMAVCWWVTGLDNPPRDPLSFQSNSGSPEMKKTL